jgi:hypothetical protein
MTNATRAITAGLLAAALGCGALAQDKPAAAPGAPGKAPAAAQDLEPSVDTSAATNDAAAQPKGAPQVPSGPAAAPAKNAAKGAPKAAAGAADGKPKGNAKDRIELDTTQITGNRELPKVLYIVPWKHSDLSDLAGRPANSLLDEVLTPVDRDVFQRENRYYRALQPDEPRPGGRAPGAPSGAAPASPSADAPRTGDEK